MRLLRGLILFALTFYVGVGLIACAAQDRLIYFPNAEPARLPAGMGIEALTLDTADGERLAAWTSDAGEGCPTFLLFHGNAGHLEQGLFQYREIMQTGAGFLAVSWRGYAGSTGKPSEEGLIEDARAGYGELIARGVRPSDIVVHGFSLGAAPGIRIAAENEIGALILEAPFLSAEKRASEMFPLLPVGLLMRDTYRSDQHIGAVDAPILIVHGTADEVIPPHHSEALAALATAPTERLLIIGASHNTLLASGLYDEAVWPFLAPKYPRCPIQEVVQ